jgi:hypothetical protein
MDSTRVGKQAIKLLPERVFYLLVSAFLFGRAMEADAAVSFVPYGAVRYQQDSNLFAVPSNNPVVAANGEPTLEDTSITYLGGVETDFTFGRQKLYADMEWGDWRYTNFSQLNHGEYRLNGGLDWAISEAIDGGINYQKNRRQVTFVDRNQRNNSATLETEEVFGGLANFKLTRTWLLTIGEESYSLDTPQPDLPLFGYSKLTSNAGLKYVGFNRLEIGVAASVVDGEFVGLANNGTSDYEQNTLGFTADYVVSDRTSFNAEFGYASSRLLGIGAENKVSGTVGTLAYVRRLTGKTTLNLQLVQAIEAYVYNEGGIAFDVNNGAIQKNSGVSATINWDATPRTSVNLNYSSNLGKFDGGSTQTNLVDREDKFHAFGLSGEYRVSRWLIFSPFLRSETQDSNIKEFDYKKTVYGLEIRVRFDRSPD